MMWIDQSWFVNKNRNFE